MTRGAAVGATLFLSLLAVALAQPAYADPATCSWEWGGVAEATPAPCDEPTAPVVVELDGAGLPVPVAEVSPVVNANPLPVAEVSPVVPPTEVSATGSFALSDDQETTITYGFAFLIFLLTAHVIRSWVRSRA